VTGTRYSTILALSTVSGVLLWSTACEPYEPEVGGAAFVLPGAHVDLACEECHGPPPFETMVWDTTCISCHDLDRKDDAAHAGYQTCTGSGCHEDTHLLWTEAVLAVEHDFLPIDETGGPHAIACESCHGSPTPSLIDVVPEGGNSTYCWSCHEAERGLHPNPLHFVDDPVVDVDVLPDSELRWDCKACHDQISQGQLELSAQWALFAIPHGKQAGQEVKVPHGTQGGGRAAPVAITDPALWVVDCADCHPTPGDFTLAAVSCSDACHAEIFETPPAQHPGTLLPGVDLTCGLAGCHPHADIRQE
jgi:hypothetical protein